MNIGFSASFDGDDPSDNPIRRRVIRGVLDGIENDIITALQTSAPAQIVEVVSSVMSSTHDGFMNGCRSIELCLNRAFTAQHIISRLNLSEPDFVSPWKDIVQKRQLIISQLSEPDFMAMARSWYAPTGQKHD